MLTASILSFLFYFYSFGLWRVASGKNALPSVMQTGFVMGGVLAVALGVSFDSLAVLFTRDTEVLGILKTGVLVCVTSTFISDPLFILSASYVS